MRHLDKRTVNVAAAVVLAVVLYQSYRFVPEAFRTVARLGLLALETALVSLAFMGWGQAALRILGARRAQSVAAAWAAGAVVSATLAGWLAQLWWPDLLLWGPWLGAGVVLAWHGRRRIAWQLALPPATPLLLLLVPFVLAALFLALAPPVSLDSLVYHLALPKQFALAGRLFPMPWNLHTFFPLHAEMLYGLCLALDASGRLAQLLHLTAALVTLSAVLELGRRLGPGAGVWSAVVLFTLPVLTLVSGWAWSDWFVLLYAALALQALLALRRGDNEDGAALLLFAAAAPAVKYNALPLLALPALAWRRFDRRQLITGAGLALALLAPWYGRNLVLTGNPLYPLLSDAAGVGSLVGFRGAEGGPGKWLGYLGRPDLLDESLGALLAAAAVLGVVFAVRSWRRIWPLVAVAGVYLAVALVHHPTIRVLSPLLLAAAILVGAGLAELWQRGPRVWIAAAVALLLWINFSQVLWVVREHRPSGVALGYQKVETYLERQLDVYAAQRWIGANTEPGAGVLVVGDSRLFHLDRPAIAASYLDRHPLRGFLRPAEELPALIARLRSAGIDYVLFNPAHYRVGDRREVRDELIFYADAETDAVFRALLATAEPVYGEGGVGVWRLSDAPAAVAPAAASPLP